MKISSVRELTLVEGRKSIKFQFSGEVGHMESEESMIKEYLGKNYPGFVLIFTDSDGGRENWSARIKRMSTIEIMEESL